MMNYEQMELDLRLQPERDLDENIGVLMSFAHQQLMSEIPDGTVKNRHEVRCCWRRNEGDPGRHEVVSADPADR